MVAALQVVGLRPGDEVVTTPFTFAATLNAILEAGASARFADIDPGTFTIDPAALETAITDRTRVVIPVHLYGQPAAMDAISALASARNLLVVEDAAQAHGATVAGRSVGSFGIGCFSLYATKNIATGEGGIITTDDDDVADRLRLLRNQGMRTRHQYEIAGRNYRLTDLQAAVAIPQLERLDAANTRRRAHAARLSSALEAWRASWRRSSRRDARTCSTSTRSASRPRRASIVTRSPGTLHARGIGTGIYYPRVVFDHDCYRDHPGVVAAEVPEAFRAAREVLSLPVHPHLSEADVDRVVGEVRPMALGA